jgi:hypothetical protein
MACEPVIPRQQQQRQNPAPANGKTFPLSPSGDISRWIAAREQKYFCALVIQQALDQKLLEGALRTFSGK